jgi:hypothetical protein
MHRFGRFVFLIQNDPFAPARRNEFDAGVLKGTLDGVHSSNRAVNGPLFQVRNGSERDERAVCQVLLRPSEEDASRFDLLRRNHASRVARNHRSSYLIGSRNEQNVDRYQRIRYGGRCRSEYRTKGTDSMSMRMGGATSPLIARLARVRRRPLVSHWVLRRLPGRGAMGSRTAPQ